MNEKCKWKIEPDRWAPLSLESWYRAPRACHIQPYFPLERLKHSRESSVLRDGATTSTWILQVLLQYPMPVYFQKKEKKRSLISLFFNYFILFIYFYFLGYLNISWNVIFWKKKKKRHCFDLIFASKFLVYAIFIYHFFSFL